MTTPATLTSAQEKLAKHLAEGGRVARRADAPEGQGFSASGFHMVQPNTAQKMLELGLMELVHEADGYEYYAAPDQPQEVPDDTPQFDDSALEQVRGKKKPEKKAAAPTEPTDILMWVGSMHYPTIDDFVTEAKAQGICKRISRFPQDLLAGKSRIFFAHDEGQMNDAVIFGYAKVNDLEVLFDPDVGEPASYSRDDISFVNMQELDEPERGCGRREEHNARYVVSRKRARLQADQEGFIVHGPLVVLEDPIDYNSVIDSEAKRYRSYRRVDGDAILASKARKSRPIDRAKALAHQELPPELRGLEIGKRWTDAERDALRQMVKRYGRKAQAFRDFSLATGRSIQGVSYQWYQRLRHQEEEGE